MSPFSLSDAAELLTIISEFKYGKSGLTHAAVDDVAEDIARVVQKWFVRKEVDYPWSPDDKREDAKLRPAIPEHVLDEIESYIQQREAPNDFVYACLTKNWNEAERVWLGDSAIIERVAFYLRLRAPGSCWGSEEEVDAWLHGPPGSFDDDRRRV